MAAASTYVWGLQRSGIHLIVNWLYANLGGSARDPLPSEGLHPKLGDGYADADASVAFYNNCGRFHCRRLELGDIQPADFEAATARHRSAIFSIEDCALRYASQVPQHEGTVHVLVLRDPLNLLASRLKAAEREPEMFRVDEPFIDVYETYCLEFLGRTRSLVNEVVVSYNRFVADRAHRDALAEQLGLPNLDVTSEVSTYGGGSSFSGFSAPDPASLMTRFEQHPLPPPMVDQLLARPAIVEVCSTVFGYELAARAGVA